MLIYLPIAELSVHAEVILLLGMGVGFLSGLFGIGGGFLTTPFLIFLGLPPAVAVGTQASQLVASSVSGVLGYWKRGDVDVKMGGVMLVGSILGTFIGVFFFKLLQYVGQIDLFIPVLYVLLLGAIGSMMFFESLSVIFRKEKKKEVSYNLYKNAFFKALPYKMRFPRSRIYISALVPAGIGFIGGILVSTLGIGGGFLIVPAMIYLLGMSPLLVAGTSLFQIIISSALATVMHALTNQTVDLILAVLLIAGSVVGAQFGVRFAKKLKGVHARFLLAGILLFVAFQLVGQLIVPPAELYSTEVR